jgi:hypothetical protein
MAIAASLSQENATLWIIANQLFGEMARFSQTKTWYSGLLAGLRAYNDYSCWQWYPGRYGYVRIWVR